MTAQTDSERQSLQQRLEEWADELRKAYEADPAFDSAFTRAREADLRAAARTLSPFAADLRDEVENAISACNLGFSTISEAADRILAARALASTPAGLREECLERFHDLWLLEREAVKRWDAEPTVDTRLTVQKARALLEEAGAQLLMSHPNIPAEHRAALASPPVEARQVEAEREACAREAELLREDYPDDGTSTEWHEIEIHNDACQAAADAIRARSALAPTPAAADTPAKPTPDWMRCGHQRSEVHLWAHCCAYCALEAKRRSLRAPTAREPA